MVCIVMQMVYNIGYTSKVEFSSEDLAQVFREAAYFISQYFDHDPLYLHPVLTDCTEEDRKYYLRLYYTGGVDSN